MQIGMIGLGRMGANMTRRLMKGGHESVIYYHNAETVHALAKECWHLMRAPEADDWRCLTLSGKQQTRML